MIRVLALSTLSVVSLSSCTLPRCAEVETPPIVAACAVPVAGWDQGPGQGDGVTANFAAVVAELGEGTPPNGCFDVGLHPGGSAPADAIWMRVTSDEDASDWIVGVVAPGASSSTLPGVGGTVSVSYDFGIGGFSPDVGQLTLRDTAGELVLWVGAAGSVETIQSPAELSIAKGEALCSEADVCGDWEKYGLSVALNGEPTDDGLTVPYGDTGALTGFSFVHGGYSESIRTSNNCSDWFVADLDAALIPVAAR